MNGGKIALILPSFFCFYNRLDAEPNVSLKIRSIPASGKRGPVLDFLIKYNIHIHYIAINNNR